MLYFNESEILISFFFFYNELADLDKTACLFYAMEESIQRRQLEAAGALALEED